jgi:hypothetical protein
MRTFVIRLAAGINVVLGIYGGVFVESALARNDDLFWLELSRVHRQLIYDCDVDIWTDHHPNGNSTTWFFLKTRRKGERIVNVKVLGAETAARPRIYPVELFQQQEVDGIGWRRRLDFALRIGRDGVPLSVEIVERSVYNTDVKDSDVICAGYPRSRNMRDGLE